MIVYISYELFPCAYFEFTMCMNLMFLYKYNFKLSNEKLMNFYMITY